MWIKICGVTRVADVGSVVGAGADAIGFNFYTNSKRYVSPLNARTLADAARRESSDQLQIDLVGVFVNSQPREIRDIADSVGLNAIQLHGDETPEQVVAIYQHCPSIPIIRAFRVDPMAPQQVLDKVDQLVAIVSVTAILLDAFVPGEFGGTGAVVDVSILPAYFAKSRPPLILAGGLKPGNVATVAVQPSLWGIDTASGVESSPGIKDSSRINEFVRQAKERIPAIDCPSRRSRISSIASIRPGKYQEPREQNSTLSDVG